VEQQIRRRANAAKDNGVINQHLYLIGWVGGWFRPYFWQAQAEDVQAEGFEPSRANAKPSSSWPFIEFLAAIAKFSLHVRFYHRGRYTELPSHIVRDIWSI
jgi:hypothetical protein